MTNGPENKPNDCSNKNYNYKETMGTSDKACCVLTGILCFIVSLMLLFYCYKQSNTALTIIANVVTAVLDFTAILSFFGIGLKINSSVIKGVLVAAFIGLTLGAILAYTIYQLQGEFGDTNPEAHPSETAQLESENLDTEPPLPTETIPSSIAVGNGDKPTASPTPTELPSHADPVTITPDPNLSAPAQSYIIKEVYQLIEPNSTAENELIAPSADNKAFWAPFLTDKIRCLVNTDTQIDSVFINGDKVFTSFTSEANRLAEDIKTNGRNFEKQLKLIELRESAYERYPIYSLRKLLSDDYFDLAELYKSEGNLEEAYHYYLKSVEYELLAIRLCREDGSDFYIHLYNLAKRLHAIGDLQDLGTDNKMEAYYLSACLFESISKSSLPSELVGYQAGSCYYAGMLNHKLMNLAWGKNDPNSSYYFLDAYNYYVASLDYKDDEQHKNSYLADLCTWAQQYIRKFGQADGMLDSNSYKQLHDEYARRVLVTGDNQLSSPD